MHRRGALQLFNLSQGQCESQVEGRTYGIPTENDNEYYQVPKMHMKVWKRFSLVTMLVLC